MIEDINEVIKLITEKTGKKKEEVLILMSKKIDELSGLINEIGAVHIVAKELGIIFDNEVTHKKDLEDKKKMAEEAEKCTKCDTPITNQKTVDFSKRKFGEVICWPCQKGNTAEELPKAKTPVQQEYGNGMFNEIQIQMIHKDTIVMLAAGEINPMGPTFDEEYDKVFNIIMKNFRKKLVTLGNKQ